MKLVRLTQDHGSFHAGDVMFFGNDADATALIQANAARLTVQWSFNQFLNRFTSAEQLGLATAALASPQIFLWFIQGAAKDAIDPTDPAIRTGLDGMVAGGHLTQQREDQILDPSGVSP